MQQKDYLGVDFWQLFEMAAGLVILRKEDELTKQKQQRHRDRKHSIYFSVERVGPAYGVRWTAC